MNARVFVDTNVIVYSRDRNKPEKQSIARDWLSELWRTSAGRISVQVLQEFYAVATGRLQPPMSRDEARANVADLFSWRPGMITREVLTDAWAIEDRFKISWWDTLIIASAQRQGCQYLLSEDMQAAQNIDGLTIVNPFETSANQVL